MTAQEESHETKQGQNEDRHEPRFLVSPALKVKSLRADRLLASHNTKPDRAAALALARALTDLPEAQPLPDPLPSPSEAPVSYLSTVAQRVDSLTVLALEEQSALVIDLSRGMRDPDFAADARSLMQRLHKRKDLFATIADEIDELLRIPGPRVKQLAPLSAARPLLLRRSLARRRGVNGCAWQS